MTKQEKKNMRQRMATLSQAIKNELPHYKLNYLVVGSFATGKVNKENGAPDLDVQMYSKFDGVDAENAKFKIYESIKKHLRGKETINMSTSVININVVPDGSTCMYSFDIAVCKSKNNQPTEIAKGKERGKIHWVKL